MVLEDKYRGLFESAPDAMVVVNERGEILVLNLQVERIFCYGRDELLGQPVTRIIPGALAERLFAGALRPSEDALAQPMASGMELTGVRKDGSEFPVEVTLSPLRSVDGPLVIAAIRDTSVRRAAESQLQNTLEGLARSNAELEGFTNLASHDLQEPLRKILSFGSRLESGEYGLTEAGTDYVRRMQGAAARMQALIQNLLAYSRVTVLADPFQSVPLENVVADVLTDLEVLIERTGAQIEVGPLPRIDCDATQMRELFQNLLANAIKFRNESAPIKIRVSSFSDVPGMVTLVVQDNGIGFDAAQAETIFGMFQRLHDRNHYEGTGIGLAVCRKIAVRHGGDITAESSPAEGTRFSVRLPLRRSASNAPS